MRGMIHSSVLFEVGSEESRHLEQSKKKQRQFPSLSQLQRNAHITPSRARLEKHRGKETLKDVLKFSGAVNVSKSIGLAPPQSSCGETPTPVRNPAPEMLDNRGYDRLRKEKRKKKEKGEGVVDPNLGVSVDVHSVIFNVLISFFVCSGQDASTSQTPFPITIQCS